MSLVLWLIHHTALGRGLTIIQFLAGKVGVYTILFIVCGYRISFTQFFMAVISYFQEHISQLSPFGATRISHFEVLCCVFRRAPSTTVFHTFYTRSYNDSLFSFIKQPGSVVSCFSKTLDSIKN